MRTRRLGTDPQLLQVSRRALVLSRGSHGSGVAQVQDLLASIGFRLPASMSRAGADGRFGAETERTVKGFQQRNGLTADGLIGPKTLDALEKIIESNPALESPDPAREVAVNQFDTTAPVHRKRSVYL
jgi:peptidoglycan hydrolase-like protein with peptidoglycan-binding domain